MARLKQRPSGWERGAMIQSGGYILRCSQLLRRSGQISPVHKTAWESAHFSSHLCITNGVSQLAIKTQLEKVLIFRHSLGVLTDLLDRCLDYLYFNIQRTEKFSKAMCYILTPFSFFRNRIVYFVLFLFVSLYCIYIFYFGSVRCIFMLWSMRSASASDGSRTIALFLAGWTC